MKNAFYAALLASIALWVGCASDSTQQQNLADAEAASGQTDNPAVTAEKNRISPPIADANVPLTRFQVEPHKKTVHRLDNGTEIHIPAATLVDETGSAVTGKVDMQYREFHDVADVLLSGIPMHYDSAGEEHILQTAGMLEIRASQNGKPVFIAEGKEVEIRMASFIEGEDYNLYAFNEEGNGWNYLRTSDPQPMPGRNDNGVSSSEVLKQLPEEPYKPKMLGATAIPFNFEVDYSKFEDLEPYRDLVWQDAGMVEEGCVNPNKEDWIFGEIWTDASVEEHPRKRGVYYLTISNAGKNAKLLVTPVVEEENYAQAMEVYNEIRRKQEELKTRLIAEARNRQTQLARMASIQRSFEINSFGVYNCDRIMRMEQQNVLAASFEVEGYDGNLDMVYLVMPGENAMIPYHKVSWKNFKYSGNTENKIVAFLPSKEAVIFDGQDFRGLKGKNNYTFVMKPTGKKVSSPTDLKVVLGV